MALLRSMAKVMREDTVQPPEKLAEGTRYLFEQEKKDRGFRWKRWRFTAIAAVICLALFGVIKLAPWSAGSGGASAPMAAAGIRAESDVKVSAPAAPASALNEMKFMAGGTAAAPQAPEEPAPGPESGGCVDNTAEAAEAEPTEQMSGLRSAAPAADAWETDTADGLPGAAKRVFEAAEPKRTPADWGLRWVWNHPEVTVVLSGMNSLEMVEANCRVAGEAQIGAMTPADLETIEKVKRAIREKEKVGCTGCRYCMPCPKGVDIPGIFRCWNTMYTESKSAGRSQFIQTVGLTREPAFASQCTRCGKCEQHCPQSIPIREKLQEADRALRPLPYKIGIQAARAFMFRKPGAK